MFPVIIIVLCLFTGIGYFLYLKGKGFKNNRGKTAQDFINVIDIDHQVLKTREGLNMMYFQIRPISIELLSKNEKEQLCQLLTAELSSVKSPFKLIAVSKPLDISSLIEDYKRIIHESDDYIQKELLRHEIYELSDYVLSGEIVERQFYIQVWGKAEMEDQGALKKRVLLFMQCFENCNIKCHLLSTNEIIGLCNLINNGCYEMMEEMN